MGDFGSSVLGELGRMEDSFQRQVEGLAGGGNGSSALSSDSSDSAQESVHVSHGSSASVQKQQQVNDRMTQLRSQLAVKSGNPQFHQRMQQMDQEILELHHQRQKQEEERSQVHEEEVQIRRQKQEIVRNEQMERIQQQLRDERGNGAGETAKRTG